MVTTILSYLSDEFKQFCPYSIEPLIQKQIMSNIHIWMPAQCCCCCWPLLVVLCYSKRQGYLNAGQLAIIMNIWFSIQKVGVAYRVTYGRSLGAWSWVWERSTIFSALWFRCICTIPWQWRFSILFLFNPCVQHFVAVFVYVAYKLNWVDRWVSQRSRAIPCTHQDIVVATLYHSNLKLAPRRTPNAEMVHPLVFYDENSTCTHKIP